MEKKIRFERHVSDTYKDHIAIINGKEYIDMSVFQNAITEYVTLDALIGYLINRLGKFEITEEEMVNYISGQNSQTDVFFDKGKYVLSKIKKK